MSAGKIGLEPEGLSKMVKRRLQLPLVHQGVAEIVVRLGKVGLQLEGLLESRHRLV